MKSAHSLLEHLDPRTKIISFLAIVICILFTPISHIKEFGLYFLLIMAITHFSSITPQRIVKTVGILSLLVCVLTMFIPFIIKGHAICSFKLIFLQLDITYEGIWLFLHIMVKSVLFFILCTVAYSVITLPDFLRGLHVLHVPQLLIFLSTFTYCYLRVMVNEVRRQRNKFSLRFGKLFFREQVRGIRGLIYVFLNRTLERSKKMYCSLITRDVEGTKCRMLPLRFSLVDFLFITGIVILLLCIFCGIVNKIEYFKVNKTHLWQRF